MIHIKLTNAMSFQEMADKAQTDEEVNFVRKLILNAGGDPNKYFDEQRTILKGENITQLHNIENGDS